MTTQSLWDSIAMLRSFDVDQMIELLNGRDHMGELHWAPLRESLTRPEATQLIDWLVVKESRVAAAGEQPERPAPVPYNELPEGY